jgi:hypothetical protein
MIDTLGLHFSVGRPAQPMQQMEAHYDFIGSFTPVRRSRARVVSKMLAQGSRAIMVTPPSVRTLLKKTRAQLNPLPHSSPAHDTKDALSSDGLEWPISGSRAPPINPHYRIIQTFLLLFCLFLISLG